MKIASLLATTAALLLTSALHAQAPAAQEVVETNLIFALKLHIQQPQVVQGTKAVGSYKIVTIKTADIIRMIGEKEGMTFSRRARILFSETYVDGEAETEFDFIIRDGDAPDHVVTSYISSVIPFYNESPFIVQKGKVSNPEGVGRVSLLTLAKQTVALAGDLETPTQGFEMVGPAKIAYKAILSRKLDEEKLIILSTTSMPVSGRGIQIDGNSGYITGTIKVTGPKVLK